MAGSYDKGSQVKISCTFTDVNGVAVDPTTVTVKYENPSGTETVFVYGTDAEVVKSAVGVYYVLVDVDETGTWYYRFDGAGAAVAASEAEFYVRSSEF